MHQRAITEQEFANLYERLDVKGLVKAGVFWTTSGVHPELGAVTVIQDTNPGLILLSEYPFGAV